MKTIISSFLMLCAYYGLNAQIDQYYNYARPGTKTVSPVSSFDAGAAKASLEPGSATIKGVVMLKAQNRSNTNIEQEVYLFPATPYFEEFLNLKKKNKKKKVITSEVFSAAKRAARIDDENGNFIFSNVKPGKYFLYTELYLLGSGSGAVRTGNQQWGVYNNAGNRVGGYTTPIYENKTWMTSKINILSKEVNVNESQQTVKVEL